LVQVQACVGRRKRSHVGMQSVHTDRQERAGEVGRCWQGGSRCSALTTQWQQVEMRWEYSGGAARARSVTEWHGRCAKHTVALTNQKEPAIPEQEYANQ